MLMARAAALALPETVIALNENTQMSFVLRRFMFTLTGVTAAGVAILIATPLLNLYLLGVQNAPLSVAELVKAGVIWLLLFPALSVIAFGLRGFLISAKRTNPVNMGMALNVIVTVLVLIGFVRTMARHHNRSIGTESRPYRRNNLPDKTSPRNRCTG